MKMTYLHQILQATERASIEYCKIPGIWKSTLIGTMTSNPYSSNQVFHKLVICWVTNLESIDADKIISFNKAFVFVYVVGCSLLLYPGAFNMTTGPAHWELLVRARYKEFYIVQTLCHTLWELHTVANGAQTDGPTHIVTQ